ncbi:GPP34 family phosphoprotein [Streptomyces sp. NPDC005096]|uniref:GOLPH3/VPS74 family protein n=1 Tax=Streptomyces sp. NPDC005096 TaxID=3154559 RepID=UPI0033B93422
MTTPQDLLIVVLDEAAGHPVAPGELSLALAGAELIDLLKTPTIRLDGGRIVPGHLPGPADPLLTQAAAALVMHEPYELVSDWLWRRGNSLADTYMTALEAQGLLVRESRRLFRPGHRALADSPSRHRAAKRWARAEPVLLALMESLGISGKQANEPLHITDYAVETVLAAVGTALQELQTERQRRTIEQAAFDNLWRDPA